MASILSVDSNDRKARLAKLASLKRKQPDASPTSAEQSTDPTPPSVTTTYLSGRNFDPSTRGPKLGFESAPTDGQTTLEDQADAIARETSEVAKAEEAADRPIDLFKLQPKKPNWDLKRDLDEKLRVLNVRTENAIARLVRERIEGTRKAAKAGSMGKSVNADMEGEEVGIDGDSLVQGVHIREKEEEGERREKDEEEEDDMIS